jgi:hypothetical protein
MLQDTPQHCSRLCIGPWRGLHRAYLRETGASGHTTRRRIVGLDLQLNLGKLEVDECVVRCQENRASRQPAPPLGRKCPVRQARRVVALKPELTATNQVAACCQAHREGSRRTTCRPLITPVRDRVAYTLKRRTTREPAEASGQFLILTCEMLVRILGLKRIQKHRPVGHHHNVNDSTAHAVTALLACVQADLASAYG